MNSFNCKCDRCRRERCRRERVTLFKATMYLLILVLFLGVVAGLLSGCESSERTYPAPPPAVLGYCDPLPSPSAV